MKKATGKPVASNYRWSTGLVEGDEVVGALTSVPARGKFELNFLAFATTRKSRTFDG